MTSATNTPGIADQIASLRRQWEMVRKSLPDDEKTLELILEAQPEPAREGLRKQFREIAATRDLIEKRLKALESTETPTEENSSMEEWQHLLMKVMLFGWPTISDFVRLEGRMPESWPATMSHHSVADWLPFTDWCTRYWIREGRVSSVLALDVKPETACRISPPLRMAYITSSQHDMNLAGFLSLPQDGQETGSHRRTLAPSVAETGHKMALELTPGTVEAVLLGREAWKKWSSLEPVMKEWMFSELAAKSLYLAVECGEEIHPHLSGWTPDEQGPERGVWRVWRTTTPPPAGTTSTLCDLRSRSLRIDGVDSVRRAILTEGHLTIFHGNASTMLKERDAWKSVSGLHPMLPSLAEGTGDLYFQLHLPGEDARWMPVGRRESLTTADQLAGLFSILKDRELLPPSLGVGDFITSKSCTFLSRIGFEGERSYRDPLERLLETMAAWHLLEVPAGSVFDPDHPLSVSSFPAPFRDLAKRALDSMSFRDLMTRKSDGPRHS